MKVTFQPEGKAAHVLPGSLIIEAAARAGIIIETPCGGRGTCGKCRVIVQDGCSETTDTERGRLTADELAEGVRLACQAKVMADTSVTVPEASRFFEQRILASGEGGTSRLCPAVAKRAVELAEPTLEDPAADSDRLLASLDDDAIELDIGAVRQLGSAARGDGGQVTAVLHGHDLIAVEPGDTTAQCFGLAVDVGTTTVVGSLLDLATGHELGVASRTNPQVAHGDDVIARISHAGDAEGLAQLQGKITECLNDIIGELTATAGVSPDAIYQAVIAGNTTMNHLFLGIDPSHVALMPYPAVLRRGGVFAAVDLGVGIHPRGRVITLPNIAGFVGGDTVGVVLATRLLERDKPTLAVDIGTNGEMVLGTRHRMVCCSTAAGPAFEGARIRYGMRAAEGAIEQVRLGDDVEVSVIENVPPRGLCGSALISLVAALLQRGILESTGRLVPPDALPADLPEALRRRVVEHGGAWAFAVATEEESALDEAILLTQRDVRELQLAKGAIRAGIEILVHEFGIESGDIDCVLLAGGFGNFIRRGAALRIGLLPLIEHERIRFVGNAAIVGAKMALACNDYMHQAEEISRRTEYIELGALPEFQMRFADAMMFPEEG
ncbi:MAG: DUF4445 domain-containing protein [Candidatus Brocadiae bacterium]|nr:DUF4445 domain-containing protein [Candidatus Brocadiia bacterium]